MKRIVNVGLLVGLTLCFVGCVTTPEEETDVLFASIPGGITKEQAIKAVYTSAIRREWKVSDTADNELELKLNHRNYKALLDFTFSENEIRYSDSTTYYVSDQGRSYLESEDASGWKKRSAPENWIVYLQRDVDKVFRRLLLDNEKYSIPSSDPIADKLISLKKLFDQDLITEEEYQKKREEILSGY